MNQNSLSDHLANERTYLAYVRTTIALISFGITINRFSLYLIQLKELDPTPMGRRLFLADTEQLGFTMVIAGIVLIIWSAIRYTVVSNQIERGEFVPNRTMIWLMTVGILALGALSVIWLFQR